MKTQEVVVGAELFTASAQRIVDYLNAHTPIPDWSVSRVTGGEQVWLHAHPGDLIVVGERRAWEDTYCVRMLTGANRVVPDTRADPDFADHPAAEVARTYAGHPITDDDGTTFGTLCGVGPEPLPGEDAVDPDLIALMGDLLSMQLSMARAADRSRRAAEIAEALAQTDALTSLINRRGWDLLVADAQQRIDAYGDLVAVAVIDLDGLKRVNDSRGHKAGDEMLRRAGEALAAVEQPRDRVARYGGDEFAILSNNVHTCDLEDHFGRFVDSLAQHGLEASMGWSMTNPGVTTMTEAFAQADADMYAEKQARRAG